MIDKDTFAAGMGILAGTFGRNADAAVNRTYYQTLSPQMTTEEFERAVQIVVATETYWPAPAVLLGKVRQKTGAQQALAALVDDLRTHGGFRFYSHERFMALPAPVREGIRAVGGLREITMCDVDRFPALERKFAEAYTEAVSRTPAIAPVGGRDRQLPAGDERPAA